MEEDHASGDDAECEPEGSHGEALRPPGALPAVSSVADQLAGKTWVPAPEVKFDFLADSPALRSVMDAMTPSASEAALGISKLIGGDHLAQMGAAAAFKLTDLWVNQPGRVWDELNAGPALGAKWAAEAADRAREAMGDLGLGVSGLGSHIAGAVTPMWEGLSGASALASSFLPAGPQPSVMSAFTPDLAGKGLAGPDLGAFAGLDLGSPS
ncbi:hypothetical protein, partial [Mycobacterium avium]|uniref:hypothetical protein n=1 Tax=Mycobacterium avium TaxID=1764 RepID=UPI0015C45888